MKLREYFTRERLRKIIFYALYIFIALIVQEIVLSGLRLGKYYAFLLPSVAVALGMFEGSFCFFPDGSLVGELHDLWQVGDDGVARDADGTGCRLLQSCYDFQHRALAGTVLADQCDAVVVVYHVADVREEWFGTELNA